MTFDHFLHEACPLLNLESRKYRRRSPRRSARQRIDARMEALGLQGYDEYLETVRSTPAERALLPDLMRVTITRFFRDAKAWVELRERVIPEMLAERSARFAGSRLPAANGGGEIVAWSAGCCGGEEPYSLSLLWLQDLWPIYPGMKLHVIATDIDADSLERARRAVYRKSSLREVPEDIRSRWFTGSGDEWQLAEEAKSLVTLRESNLLTDPPPLEVDLVLCRYLAFTYFKGSRLGAAALKLWESLRPGGILMIGAKESLDSPALDFFEPLPETRFFYRRRS